MSIRFNTFIALLLALTASHARAQTNTLDLSGRGFDENKIAFFLPRIQEGNPDLLIQLLAKNVSHANELGIDGIDIRFSNDLTRTICCFSLENYDHSDRFQFDQSALVFSDVNASISYQDVLYFCNKIPFDRQLFKEMDFEHEIRGSNNSTPFHTTISNHPILLKLVCGAIVAIPEKFYADQIASVRFIDEKTERREILIVLRYAKNRLSRDIALQSSLESRGVRFGNDVGYFIFTEPKKEPDSADSKCYRFLSQFIDEKLGSDEKAK